MFDLNKRVEVVSAVAEKFVDRPLVLGEYDCVHMIAFGLHQYGFKSGLSKFGSYSTPAGARRALKKAGYSNLREAVSGQGFFELEGAALAWPGDILGMKSEDGEEIGLAWMASGGRALGFWGGRCQYFQPLAFECAWRVS